MSNIGHRDIWYESHSKLEHTLQEDLMEAILALFFSPYFVSNFLTVGYRYVHMCTCHLLQIRLPVKNFQQQLKAVLKLIITAHVLHNKFANFSVIIPQPRHDTVFHWFTDVDHQCRTRTRFRQNQSHSIAFLGWCGFMECRISPTGVVYPS